MPLDVSRYGPAASGLAYSNPGEQAQFTSTASDSSVGASFHVQIAGVFLLILLGAAILYARAQ